MGWSCWPHGPRAGDEGCSSGRPDPARVRGTLRLLVSPGPGSRLCLRSHTPSCHIHSCHRDAEVTVAGDSGPGQMACEDLGLCHAVLKLWTTPPVPSSCSGPRHAVPPCHSASLASVSPRSGLGSMSVAGSQLWDLQPARPQRGLACLDLAHHSGDNATPGLWSWSAGPKSHREGVAGLCPVCLGLPSQPGRASVSRH